MNKEAKASSAFWFQELFKTETVRSYGLWLITVNAMRSANMLAGKSIQQAQGGISAFDLFNPFI